MHILSPPKSDYGFYSNYVFLAPDTDLITAFRDNYTALKALTDSLTEDELLHRYDTGKWNIKEVLVHLIDAERNFCYRAMRISRRDQAPLPALDVHEFIANSFATEREIAGIMNELSLVRQATIAMYEGMHPSMLERTGPARDVTISVHAIGYATVGHTIHHMNIIKERYLRKK